MDSENDLEPSHYSMGSRRPSNMMLNEQFVPPVDLSPTEQKSPNQLDVPGRLKVSKKRSRASVMKQSSRDMDENASALGIQAEELKLTGVEGERRDMNNRLTVDLIDDPIEHPMERRDSKYGATSSPMFQKSGRYKEGEEGSQHNSNNPMREMINVSELGDERISAKHASETGADGFKDNADRIRSKTGLNEAEKPRSSQETEKSHAR